jgi:TadE-like protein
MADQAGRRRPAHPLRKQKAQSLVELAIVLPLMVGIVAVLFQLGILFIAYLSLVHETRDIGRFVSVHPDTIDGSLATACTATGTLWRQVCDDAPTVVDKTKVTPTFSPACASLTALKCTGRNALTQMHITLQYDASSIIFLPATFRLGPWLNVAIPTSLPAYDYYVMVEQH